LLCAASITHWDDGHWIRSGSSSLSKRGSAADIGISGRSGSHTLPGSRSAAEIWKAVPPHNTITDRPAYRKFLEEGALDSCGVTLLAGKAVGAPFVGSVTACLAVSEVLRLLNADKKTLAYQLGEALSQMTDHYLLMTATPHKGDPTNFCLFLSLLDRDVYGDVKSLEDAMARHEAPFYLRRLKEALVTFPEPETGTVRAIFTKRLVRTTPFEINGGGRRLLP
jgi:hypothetical protein